MDVNTFWMNWNANCTSNLLERHQCLNSLMFLWHSEQKSPQPQSKITKKKKIESLSERVELLIRETMKNLEYDFQKADMGMIVRCLHTFGCLCIYYICIISALVLRISTSLVHTYFITVKGGQGFSQSHIWQNYILFFSYVFLIICLFFLFCSFHIFMWVLFSKILVYRELSRFAYHSLNF